MLTIESRNRNPNRSPSIGKTGVGYLPNKFSYFSQFNTQSAYPPTLQTLMNSVIYAKIFMEFICNPHPSPKSHARPLC